MGIRPRMIVRPVVPQNGAIPVRPGIDGQGEVRWPIQLGRRAEQEVTMIAFQPETILPFVRIVRDDPPVRVGPWIAYAIGFAFRLRSKRERPHLPGITKKSAGWSWRVTCKGYPGEISPERFS